jgi:hypothetical protein
VRESELGSLDDEFHLLLTGGMLMLRPDEAVADVFKDGRVEEDRLLLDETHARAQPAQVEVLERGPVERDGARGDVVPALEQADDGRLAAARGADEGGDLAGGDVEGEVVEDADRRARRVGEGDVADGNVTADGRGGLACCGERVDAARPVDELEEGCGGAGGAREGHGVWGKHRDGGGRDNDAL